MGFQTARQINNKLKEPNRMKKDPLTQTSINSFFFAGTNKREPEDNMVSNQNEQNYSQNAKRRKVSDSNNYTNVTIKSEPIDEPMDDDLTDTFHGAKQKIKTEPPEFDSDNDTDKESDGEDANGTSTNAQTINAPHGHKYESKMETHNVPQHSMASIKVENNSDNDTDTPSDGEDNEPTSIRDENPTTRPFRIKTEPGVQQQSSVSGETQSTMHYNEQQMNEMNEMNVDTGYEEFKKEPQDDQIDSAQETDADDNNDMKDPSVYRATASSSSRHPTTSTSQINHCQENQAQQVSNVNEYTGNNIEWYQQPSTSSQPPIHSCEFDNSQTHSRHEFKQLNAVGLESSTPAYRVDGKPLLRFNHLESPINEAPSQYVNNDDNNDDQHDDDDDDVEFTDPGFTDEIKKYVKIVENTREQKHEDEWNNLTNISIDKLSKNELAEVNRKLAELRKKHNLVTNQLVTKARRERHEERDQTKDEFLRNLFGPFYDFDKFERACRIDTDDTKYAASSASASGQYKPSTSTKADANDKKDVKPITWREFMGIPKTEEDHKKSDQEHYVSMLLEEHIQNMHKEKRLNEVPEHAIKHVRKDKEMIKNKVANVLMPYLQSGQINKKQYEKICRTGTHDCFENNIFGELFYSPLFLIN